MRGIEALGVGFERCILTGKREYLLILYPTFPLLDRIHFTINSDFFPLYGFQGFDFTFLSAFQGRYLIPLKSPCPFLWVQFNQIITGIVIGISVGSHPIIGYNYGAGKTARAQKTYLLAIVCSTIVMGLGKKTIFPFWTSQNLQGRKNLTIERYMRNFPCQAALRLSDKQMMNSLRSLDISVDIFGKFVRLVIIA